MWAAGKSSGRLSRGGWWLGGEDEVVA